MPDSPGNGFCLTATMAAGNEVRQENVVASTTVISAVRVVFMHCTQRLHAYERIGPI